MVDASSIEMGCVFKIRFAITPFCRDFIFCTGTRRDPACRIAAQPTKVTALCQEF